MHHGTLRRRVGIKRAVESAPGAEEPDLQIGRLKYSYIVIDVRRRWSRRMHRGRRRGRPREAAPEAYTARGF